jgi:hypothetical protein
MLYVRVGYRDTHCIRILEDLTIFVQNHNAARYLKNFDHWVRRRMLA